MKICIHGIVYGYYRAIFLVGLKEKYQSKPVDRYLSPRLTEYEVPLPDDVRPNSVSQSSSQ
jgi:hypothetical protein